MACSIALRCRACGEEAGDPRHDGGGIAGFAGSVSWLGLEAGVEGARPLLEWVPEGGARHRLAVRFPFAATSEEPFWALYRPPLAHLNGWEDEPGAIAFSAVVECRLVEAAEEGPQSATVVVEVARSIPVPEIGREVAPSERAGNLTYVFGGRSSLARSGPFTHLSVDVEGDAGAWAIAERRGGDDFLILGGDWSWHVDSFRATNRRLVGAEAALFARPADR